MNVEFRQRLPLAGDLGNPIDPRHEWFERRLNFQNDLRAQSGNERRIASELDGVAEPLFRMQQNCPAAQLFAPEPQGLRKRAALGSEIARIPSQLVFRPAAAKIAQAQPGETFVAIRIRVVRLDGGCSGKGSDRLGVAIEAHQRDATVVRGRRA